MQYWIDGYNLLFKVKNHLHTLEQGRKSLIQELQLHLIKSGIKASIIFDSADEHSHEFPNVSTQSQLEIRFSPQGLTADEYILEKLTAVVNPKNITVVTDDSGLAFHCHHLSAKNLSVESFFDLIFKKERKRKLSDYEFLRDREDVAQESEENIAMFVKIFEERLKRDEEAE